MADDIVTMKTLHDDIQEIKKYIYRSEGDYKKIKELESADEITDKRLGKLENKVAALMVIYGIAIAIITAILVDYAKGI